MAYQALYRKYRPRKFADIVGQSHITTILQNQVQAAQVGHAYLFTGSRGTGKTSTAKIFARAVNCLQPAEGDACGVCEACKSMQSDSVDIIEIDAASNNGVDDVRALIEQARYTPLHLKYKVYIIDEVHMLSTAASNALLKTLEEPPAHVLFLLATTEAQKILPTVISRCQRYDFRRLQVSDIVSTLKSVLALAGAQIEEEGLRIIARAADGGMRDALSIADQCLSFCGAQVSARDVYDVLGSMDADFLFSMSEALLTSDARRALTLMDEIVCGGKDLGVFAQDLSFHLRALLVAKTCGDCAELLDCTPETMARYKQQAAAATQERLLRALELLQKTQNEMKWLGRPRVLLESMLVRICRPEDETNIDALMDRIAALEQAARFAPQKKTAPQAFTPPAPALPEDVTEIAASAPPWADDAPPEENAEIGAAPWEEDAPPWDMVPPPPADGPLAAQAPPLAKEPAAEPKEAIEEEAKKEETEEAPPWEAPQSTQSTLEAPPPAAEEAPAPKDAGNANFAITYQNALKKSANSSIYMVMRHAQSVVLEGDTLYVTFPQSKESFANVLSMPRNFEEMKKILAQLRPGVQLRIQSQSPRSAKAPEELVTMFGDKLRVRE